MASGGESTDDFMKKEGRKETGQSMASLPGQLTIGMTGKDNSTQQSGNRWGKTPSPTITTTEEIDTRDKEIAELRRTLKDLSTSPKKMPSRNMLSPGDALNIRRRSLQMEGRLQHLGEHDYVPEHLVAPIRPKIKGALQRVVNDDLVDMGTVTASKHPSLVKRRCSDPGRVSPGLLLARQRLQSSGSSSDDEEHERTPRSRSPRRLIGSLPEDECYPSSSLHVEGRMSPGWASPRRRLVQHRHSACVALNPLAGDESPRIRARKSRSNSLPMAHNLWPERSALEVGEAIGALATKGNNGNNETPSSTNSATSLKDTNSQQASAMHTQAAQQAAIRRTSANRCVSIEEPPLEAILEEAGSRAQYIRRYSMPNPAYARAATRALKPFP